MRCDGGAWDDARERARRMASGLPATPFATVVESIAASTLAAAEIWKGPTRPFPTPHTERDVAAWIEAQSVKRGDGELSLDVSMLGPVADEWSRGGAGSFRSFVNVSSDPDGAAAEEPASDPAVPGALPLTVYRTAAESVDRETFAQAALKAASLMRAAANER